MLGHCKDLLWDFGNHEEVSLSIIDLSAYLEFMIWATDRRVFVGLIRV